MWFLKKREITPIWKKSKVNKIRNSFKYAGSGILSAFKSELNMQVHLCMMFLVIICGFSFKISLTEWRICIILFGIVIGSEIFNKIAPLNTFLF